MWVACLQPPSITGDAHSMHRTQSLLFSSITTENGANSSIPLYPTPSEQSEHSVSTRFSGSSTPAVTASSTSLAVSMTCNSNERMKHSIQRSPCGDLDGPGELFTKEQAAAPGLTIHAVSCSRSTFHERASQPTGFTNWTGSRSPCRHTPDFLVSVQDPR